MSSWTDIFLWAREWLTAIWNGIFGIEFFDGLTFKVLFIGLLMVVFSVSIYRFFISNTHAEMGAYYTVTDSLTYNHDTGKSARITTTTYSRRHRRK